MQISGKIVDYASSFGLEARETILKEIADNNILEEFFETTQGKVIANNVINSIALNVVKIIGICRDETPAVAVEKLHQPATEINLAYKIIVDWANILVTGKKHKDKIK